MQRLARMMLPLLGILLVASSCSPKSPQPAKHRPPRLRPMEAAAWRAAQAAGGANDTPPAPQIYVIPPLPSPLFQAVDKDNNLELSTEEVLLAPAVLQQLDRNDDGVLTHEELVANWAEHYRVPMLYAPAPTRQESATDNDNEARRDQPPVDAPPKGKQQGDRPTSPK